MIALSAPGAELSAAAAWVSRLCPARPPMPHLGGVLLRADDDGLTLAATDLDKWAQVAVKASVAHHGAALVSGRLLAAVTKAAGRAADVGLALDGDGLTARAGRGTWTVPVMPAEDFPAAPDLGEPVATLDGTELATAMGRVLPATDRDAAPPLRHGVLLTPTPEALLALATDRFRLAEAAIPWRPATGAPVGMVVPAELVELAARTGGAGPVRLRASGRVVSLESATHQVTGRLIDEPADAIRRNIQRIIPPLGGRPYVTVPTVGLVEAVESATVVSQVEAEPVALTLTESMVTVSLAEQGRGATAEALLSGADGEPPEMIWIKPANLLVALRCARAEQVMMSFGPDATSSVLVVPLGDDGQPEPGYLHLLMPVSSARRKRPGGQR